jgi:hypothetical protein
MKTLIFDFENGSKSLGSEVDIQRLFGYPVLKPSAWQSTRSILDQIWTKQSITDVRHIGNIPVRDSGFKYVPRNGTQVNTLVFDTATEAFKQYQRELRGKGKMTLPMWGEMKNDIDAFLAYINQLPCNVILNVHAKTIKDEELGILKYIPNIEGSTREDMGKWFDFVFYCKVKKDENGGRHFMWVTSRDDRWEHAKDRTQELPVEIPQNYQQVLLAAKQKGWANIKVLVIGPPGGGKTMALKTLYP